MTTTETPPRGSAPYQSMLSQTAAAFYTSRDGTADGHGMELLRIITLGYGAEGVFDLCTHLTLVANQLAAPGLRDSNGRVDLDLLLEEPGHPDEEVAVLAARAGRKVTEEGRYMVGAIGRFRPVLQEAVNLTGPDETLWHAVRGKLTSHGSAPRDASVCATLVFTMVEAIGRIESARASREEGQS